MSLGDYYQGLAEKAGGWLHWSERRALETDVIYLENALNTHMELIGVIHFGVKPKPNRGTAKPKKVTAAAFKAFAKAHNAKFKRG